MIDIKREFTRLCGPDVAYLDDDRGQQGRRLIIKFSVTGTDVVADAYSELRDGTDSALREATRDCARLALAHAYRVTGKRDADIQNLLRGKRA